MFYEHLNEAIYGTLAKEWGFYEERFVPRTLVQELRRTVLTYFPGVLKLDEVHSDTINSAIKKEGLDQSYFDTFQPNYSGFITDTGTVRIMKSDVNEKNGQFRVYSGSADDFMKTVIHDDWKQDMPSGEFVFERSRLGLLPNNIAYLINANEKECLG